MAQVETITISAVVSGVVGLATGTLAFGVGARSQKNVADRSLLRQHYQALYGHFAALETQLLNGQPLTWASFKVIRDQHCPLVREMEIDGRANLLPPRLFETLKGTERAAVVAGSRLADAVEEHAIPAMRGIMGSRVRNPTSSISGRHYCPIPIAKLVLDPSALRDVEFGPELGLGLETSLTTGRTFLYYAYPETVAIDSISELIDDLAAISNLSELAEIKVEVSAAQRLVSAACTVLQARIRDPHPLHEAIADTFRDFAAFARPAKMRRP